MTLTGCTWYSVDLSACFPYKLYRHSVAPFDSTNYTLARYCTLPPSPSGLHSATAFIIQKAMQAWLHTRSIPPMRLLMRYDTLPCSQPTSGFGNKGGQDMSEFLAQRALAESGSPAAALPWLDGQGGEASSAPCVPDDDLKLEWIHGYSAQVCVSLDVRMGVSVKRARDTTWSWFVHASPPPRALVLSKPSHTGLVRVCTSSLPTYRPTVVVDLSGADTVDL